MAETFRISIDPANLPTRENQGLDLATLSYLRNIWVKVNADSLQAISDFISQNCDDFDIYCDCTAIDHYETILILLNNGCSKALVTDAQITSITQSGGLEKGHENRLISIQPGNGNSTQYITVSKDLPATLNDTIKKGNVAIVPADSLTARPAHFPHLFPVHHLVTSILKSDRSDGLFPTIVSDERGYSLGLVYSNEESIRHALETGRGAYYSRSKKGLWVKGSESGDTQDLISISWDCDSDALQFKVKQHGVGFCHLKTTTCFGPSKGLSKLEKTLNERHKSAPAGSYTARLFNDASLLKAKIMEEASELCEATSTQEIAAEAADLLYFALTKCVAAGVSVSDIEKDLDRKSLKMKRRKGDAKPQWAAKVNGDSKSPASQTLANGFPSSETLKEAASVPKESTDSAGLVDSRIRMKRFKVSETDPKVIDDALKRPSQKATDEIMNVVKPIVKNIQERGDKALLEYTHKFEKATSLKSPVIKSPYPSELMRISSETKKAIDTSYDNIFRFHAAQKETKPLQVETMPGVVCSRFSRPIERVGLYVPGGTAVLPSTALMLGVPAMVAGCEKIVLASPPRRDGTVTPEIVYIADRIGAESIVLAGGAQAVAALAYGTESVSKVDKILGPGNQFVTAGKMLVSNDTTAGVSIDMPAGPSEVLVIADKSSNPTFVASDLLSQAEHGTDSQVILIAIGLDETDLGAIEDELHKQANALPRVDIVRGAIDHSVTFIVQSRDEAVALSNRYAPEHLILQTENAADLVPMIKNAGSVFIGQWTPESVGDYSAGVNHSLPTYGYAKQYSGVNLSSFTKHITSSNLTQEGLKNIGQAVMQLAEVEELQAHKRAVSIRLEHMDRFGGGASS